MTTPSKDMLELMLRQAQRELAKTDPFVFGEFVFGYEPAAHHKMMVRFVLDLIDNHQNGVILAPRNSAKTTWCNTILMTWLVALRKDLRIGLFSQKDKKAYAMSNAIKTTISDNENFKSAFGDLRGTVKWTDEEWMRADSRWKGEKDRTMVAGGANSSSGVSKRFDILLLDDILDENNTYTIDQREKVETWFWKSLKPTLTPTGSVIVLGTRWTEGDLYEKMIESNKWPSIVIPAVTRDDSTGEEKSYWPEVWPLERLFKEREDVGWDNFACSYLNDISGLREGTIFKREWWDQTYFEQLPSDRLYHFTIGIDLATSVRERADWTAGVLIAEDDRHEHWVLHHERTKTEGGHREFVKGLYDWAHAHGYPVSKVIIENNQHQSTLVQDLLRETSMPVVGRRADVDKRVRARAAAARYESHRVHHHKNLLDRDLEREMVNFDRGHDDLIDALGLAMDLTTGSGSMAAVKHQPQEPGTAPPPIPPRDAQVDFIDGPRWVPLHVAELLTGIETSWMTYEQAMGQANAARLNDYVKAQLGGMLRR
jgi:phage terminase large subunit-like protein